jgi:hypothetical protein
MVLDCCCLCWGQAQAITFNHLTLLGLHCMKLHCTYYFGQVWTDAKVQATAAAASPVSNNIYNRSKVVSRASYSIELINQLHGGR